MCKHDHDENGDPLFSFGALCLGMALAFAIGAAGGGRLKETDALAACKGVGAYTLAGVRVECRVVDKRPQGH